MKLHDTPTAENLPAYQKQPISGNKINGQGVKEKARPTRVFHAVWNRELPWTGMNDFFLMNNSWAILIQALNPHFSPVRLSSSDSCLLSIRYDDLLTIST